MDNKVLNIIEKLKQNYNSDLSIEELKILYGVDIFDYQIYIDTEEYRQKRNMYEDLSKIYGKEHVARTPQEITEDTICFVGDVLIIDKILPTYNLRYIYGNLHYNLYEIYNLENLEKIYGSAWFELIKSAKGLENLIEILGSSHFNNLKSALGLENLECIEGCASFDSLKDAKGLEHLNCMSSMQSFGEDGLSLDEFRKNCISLKK